MLRFTLRALLVTALATGFMLVFQIGRWDPAGGRLYLDHWTGNIYEINSRTGERVCVRDRYASAQAARAREAEEQAAREEREEKERRREAEVRALWSKYDSQGLVTEVMYRDVLVKRFGRKSAEKYLRRQEPSKPGTSTFDMVFADYFDPELLRAEYEIKRELLRKAGAKLPE